MKSAGWSCVPCSYASPHLVVRLDLQSALLYDSLLVVAYGIMAMDYSPGLDSKEQVLCKQEKVRHRNVLKSPFSNIFIFEGLGVRVLTLQLYE